LFIKRQVRLYFNFSILNFSQFFLAIFLICGFSSAALTPNFQNNGKVTNMIKLSSKDRHWLEFLLAMTEKEIKARYKHAVLGFLWIILNPLFQMMVIGFVFQFFIPVQVDNYFLFLFAGLLPWNFFSYSISKNTPMIINERSLIQKAKFPRESIILSIVLSNLFHFLASLVLLVILLVGDKILLEGYSFVELAGYVGRMFWLVPLLAWLTLLTSGLSLLFSALNVKYRDVNFVVQAIMPLWFYGTPIVYTLDLLPKFLQPLFYLNPMTAIIEGFHYALMGIKINSMDFTLLSLAISLMIFFVGWKVFEKESKFFDDWV
jgi:lipopolysaccharide transport system permease protein